MFFRLARFLETAGSVLNYFEPFLGRIEIMGGSKRIERVYFEIKESNIEQWEKPQIKVWDYFVISFYLKTLFAILSRVIYESPILIWLEGPKIHCNLISIFKKWFVLKHIFW